MKYLQDTHWQEIWEQWKNSENTIWDTFFLEKGFSNWETWRKSYFKDLHPETFEWKLYEIEITEIPNFQCGAFPKWIEISEKVGSRYFRDLAKYPLFSQLEKIIFLKKNFPKKTSLIAFQKGSEIILFEGHHRCTAISQMLQEQIPIKTHVTIALAKLDSNKQYPVIDYSK